MNTTIDEIRQTHQQLLALLEDGSADILLEKAHAFLERMSESGSTIESPPERSQLRALIRYWSSYVYDQTGVLPSVQLMPLLSRGLQSITAQEGRILPLLETPANAPKEVPSQ